MKRTTTRISQLALNRVTRKKKARQVKKLNKKK